MDRASDVAGESHDSLARTLDQAAKFLFGIALLLTIASAWHLDWTYDERSHLEWSRRLVVHGHSDRSSAWYLNSKTPISVPNALARRAVRRWVEPDSSADRFSARLPTVLWLICIFVTGRALARRIAGARAAACVGIAIALDPNLRAHGGLATSDAAFAAATCLFVLAWMELERRPRALSSVSLGAAWGLSATAKFSGLWLLPGSLVGRALAGRAAEGPPQPRWRRFASWSLIGLAAWLVIAGSYGFTGLGAVVSPRWRSSAVATIAEGAQPLLKALPSGFVSGIDASLADERHGDWNVVVFGRRRPAGVWYYFAVAWLFKTPLPLAFLQIAGLWAALTSGAWRDRNWRFVAGLMSFLLFYFSLFFRAQIGFRFVLMCLPLGYALASGGWSSLLKRRHAKLGTALAVALCVFELLPFGRDALPFTNTLIPAKKSAFHVLADSNLDWGQNDTAIRAWRDARFPSAPIDPPHPVPGVNVFSVNRVLPVLDRAGQAWLRLHLEPVRQVLFTHLVYRLDATEFDQFLDQERKPDVAADCRRSAEPMRLPAGDSARLAASPALGICIWAARESEVRIGSEGDGVGMVAPEARSECSATPSERPGEHWYRLVPGGHRLCLAAPADLIVIRGEVELDSELLAAGAKR